MTLASIKMNVIKFPIKLLHEPVVGHVQMRALHTCYKCSRQQLFSLPSTFEKH